MDYGKVEYYYETASTYLNNSIETNIGIEVILFFTLIAFIISVVMQKKIAIKGTLLVFIYVIFYNYFFANTNPRTIQKLLDDNHYNTVLGEIKNYRAMPKSGHDTESFDVNGTHFQFGYTGNYPTEETMFFNFTKNRNGPITHNGQKVRIDYIKAGVSKLCLPFITQCILFNELSENKIIKMWVYN